MYGEKWCFLAAGFFDFIVGYTVFLAGDEGFEGLAAFSRAAAAAGSPLQLFYSHFHLPVDFGF